MYTVREWDLNPSWRYKSFVWLFITNRSDDGLIEKPQLVTWISVNCVVHDGGLECIYYGWLLKESEVSTKTALIDTCRFDT
jgi:hypothetical protein